MTDRILPDDQDSKTLVRAARAFADYSMIAFARPKHAVLSVRQSPAAQVHAGQKALDPLNQDEGQGMAMSSPLLRVHDELTAVAREKMAWGEGTPTDFPSVSLLSVEPVAAL